jgi:hypothetical protein
MGQFRLLLGIVTVVVMILAMRNYKYIYNQGSMNVTHGFMVALTVGLVSALLYSLTLLVWISFSEKLWDLHVAEMIRTLESQKEGFIRQYSIETYELQIKSIIDAGGEKRGFSKLYFALITLRDRLILSLVIGFLVTLYYRN